MFGLNQVKERLATLLQRKSANHVEHYLAFYHESDDLVDQWFAKSLKKEMQFLMRERSLGLENWNW